MIGQTQLDRIEAKLDALLLLVSAGRGVVLQPAAAAPPPPAAAPAKPAAPPTPAGAVADDADLDGKYGNPEIKWDPKRWQGASFVGKRYSECSPEYLDVVASFNDWRADQDEAKGETDKAKWPRRDASRARGWAARLRAQEAATEQTFGQGAPKMAPAEAPGFAPGVDEDDNLVPF